MKPRTVVIALASLAGFLAIGDRYVLSALYNELMLHFGLESTVVLSVLFSSFYIGYTMAQIPGGRLAEKFGPARVAGAALIAWSSFFLFIPFTGNFGISLVVAFLMGVTQGPIFPSIVFLTRLYFSDKEYGTASGVVSAIADVSPAFIPLISLGLFYRFHGIGAPFVVFGLAGIILGIPLLFVNPQYDRPPSAKRWRSLLNRRFIIFGFSFLLYDFFYYIFLTWLPYFLKERFSIPPTNFFYVSVPWLTVAVTAVFFGVLMDRIDRDDLFSEISYALMVLSVIGMALSPTPSSFIVFVSIGMSALNPSLIASWRMSTRLAGKNSSAFVGGWMNCWGNVGGIAAPVVIASLSVHFGLTDTFFISAVVPIVALITWLEMGRWKLEKS